MSKYPDEIVKMLKRLREENKDLIRENEDFRAHINRLSESEHKIIIKLHAENKQLLKEMNKDTIEICKSTLYTEEDWIAHLEKNKCVQDCIYCKEMKEN